MQEQIIYLWLYLIKGMNYYLYNQFLKSFNSIQNIFNLSKTEFLFKEILTYKNLHISAELLNEFTNPELKIKSEKLFFKLQQLHFDIIPINSNRYPKVLLNNLNPPLCIIHTGNGKNINSKNLKFSILYNSNFSSNGKTVYNIFSKYLLEQCDVVNIYNNFDNINVLDNIKNMNNTVQIFDFNIIRKSNINNYFDYFEKGYFNSNDIILTDNRSKIASIEMMCNFVDYYIVPESGLNKYIFIISELIAENSKEILVVPANIYNKTSYFSNYLIKQGCDILLSVNDIKYYIDNYNKDNGIN